MEDVFGIGQVPCDTQLREILDKVDPAQLRGAFRKVFHQLQRGNALEQMRFLGKYYLVSADGTGFYYSSNLGNDFCLEKTPRGQVEKAYHQQLYAACLVHPDFCEVIPFCPELIVKQDGKDKNDCEQNASMRLIRNFRREHPHLEAVFVEDSLHSNAPHIRALVASDLHYILGAKESDHHYLFQKAFEEEEAGRGTEIDVIDPGDPRKKHKLFFVNGIPLNGSNLDVLVNFQEYSEIILDANGNEIPTKEKHFSWVTDLEITVLNLPVYGLEDPEIIGHSLTKQLLTMC